MNMSVMITSNLILCLLLSCYLFIPALCDEPAPIIKKLHIMSDIKYTYARTLVTSRVLNPANISQEVTFKVVLPEEAFITKFLMRIKEKSYEAYIKEKEEAKKDYDAAVSAGKSAGHIFQSSSRNSKDFTVKVNVEAEGKVTFELSYEELLSRKNSSYTNVINVNPNQIVPDLKILVTIEDVLNIKYVEVPRFKMSNEIDITDAENPNAKKTKISSNKIKVEWSPTEKDQKELNAEGLNGQMVVKFDVDSSQTHQQLLIDQDGYFVHIFRHDELPALNKHVVFVLDVSASMHGRKINQLKQAMEKILSDLSENDFFSIVLFSAQLLPWKLAGVNINILDEPYFGDVSEPIDVPVSKDYVISANQSNIELAKQFMKSISDYGSTNINGGLRVGIDIARVGQDLFKNYVNPIEPMIIFLTDGEPNYEESDPEKIIANIEKRNTGKVTIFSMGFGSDADMNFLKKLSLDNNGFARRIYEDSDAALQLNNFYNEVASPVLSDVKFEYLPNQVEDITHHVKNLFSGSSMLVLGKAKDNQTVSGELSAITHQGKTIFRIPIEEIVRLPHKNQTEKFGFLEKMWVYKTIKSLLDQNTVSKNETVENKVKELALKYKFVTPFTSLVVVKPDSSSVMNDDYSKGSRGGVRGFGSTIHQKSSLGISYLISIPPMAISTGFRQESDEIDSFVNESLTTPENLSYANVTWLNKTVSEDGHSLGCSLIDDNDVIALNETDVAYNSTACRGSRKCRHFIFCVLPVFLDSPASYMSLKCHIDPKFLGVCCPF
nr:inter-alpha-trypsin inhibitor heavy chain H4-like [Halyomorpha halys]